MLYMKNILILCCLWAIEIVVLAQSVVLPVPAPRQLKWHEAEVGVLFHYDLHVFDGEVYGQCTNTPQIRSFGIHNNLRII